MELIVWDEKYSVRVSRFDQEHKKLIRLLNALIQAVVQKRSNEILAPLLDQLIVYTQTHFTSEENAMKQFAYPKWAAHHQEHEEFTAKVLAFQKDFRAGKAQLGVPILKFLFEWLLFHIRGSDAQYADFFVERGFH